MKEFLDLGAELHVYTEPGVEYRYGVGDNADFPGYVDVFYEEWDTTLKRWKRVTEMPGLPPGVFEALAGAANFVSRMTSEDRPELSYKTLEVHVKVQKTKLENLGKNTAEEWCSTCDGTGIVSHGTLQEVCPHCDCGGDGL